MIPHPPSSTLFPYTTLFRSIFGSCMTAASDFCKATLLTNRGGTKLVRLRKRSWGVARCLQRRRVQATRSEEHTSELQSHHDLVCRLLLEKKNINLIKANPNM